MLTEATLGTASEHAEALRDHEAILRHLAGKELAWDYQRSMVDMTFAKGMASPRIAGLIAAQGYIQKLSQKRYDDTAIMLVEFVKHGYSSERGAKVLERMNEVHSRFRIRQDDYLYVLTSLMFEPIRWNERFGFRPLTTVEKLAHFYFWREVGLRMDLTIIPDTYEECEAVNLTYEREQLRRSQSTAELARVLFALIETWVPGPVRPLVRPGMCALLDDNVVECFDVPKPPAWMRWLVPRALRARAFAVSLWPEMPTVGFYVDRAVRSYPNGYSISDLGPPNDWTPPTRKRQTGQIAEEKAPDARFCNHKKADPSQGIGPEVTPSA